MIVGRIFGRVNTNDFSFRIEKDIKKFDFVQVHHDSDGYILCTVTEVEKTEKQSTARCSIIGFRDDKGRIRRPGYPLSPGSEVLLADDDFITSVIRMDKQDAALLGKLEGKDIEVRMDLDRILTKHLAVLAKSGSGKSYTVGVLLEEIAQRKIPLVVIDPHGEYSSMGVVNDDKKDVKGLALYGLEPKSFDVEEYGDHKLNKSAIPLKLPNHISGPELAHLLPGRLNATQQGILYNAVHGSSRISFPELLLALEQEENSAKWGIINVLSYLNDLEIFSDSAPAYQDMLKPGKICSINLKGYSPDVQEVIVCKLCSDLFDLRKKNKVSPFFLVVEEAHNFCPERSFGEAKSSKILRNIASEGRKFGLGLCVVSQRPARVDKSVLSQCSTQIIQKVTNPNDLKALSNSVEGLNASVEKEIQNLPIGSGLITGISDIPLLVNVRPRMSMHGGRGVQVMAKHDFTEKIERFEQEELLPLMKPRITKKDLMLMQDDSKPLKTVLVPGLLFSCKEGTKEFKLLLERCNGDIVTDLDGYGTMLLPELEGMSRESLIDLQRVFRHKSVSKDSLSYASELVAKGLLKEDGPNYVLSEEHALQRLSNYQIYNSIDYEKFGFDEKEPARIEAAELQRKLSRFTKVIDKAECFVVRYV